MNSGSSAGAGTAVPAEAVQLQFVVLNVEPEPANDLFLERLDLNARKLGNLAALGADDVIVVALAGGMFEQGASVSELPLMGKPGILQEFQRPIDGNETDPLVPTPHPAVEAFGADVGRGGEESPRDQLALASRLQPGSMEVLLKLEQFILHSRR
ncbi:exported protein of unknown function [Candidatus Methylomirabilis oxygeniifera]|uniref:Uncharacterized protein n=1 Tax=Methylomirabilis oxygeniifera TaxID=671143 RepID=D5MLS8_METO1|nr:exported protein of unknown function [Candidatus Methylomirabilis oxyfera]